MNTQPLALAALLAGAIASIAESDGIEYVGDSTAVETVPLALAEDERARYLVELATAGEPAASDANISASIYVDGLTLESPSGEPLELNVSYGSDETLTDTVTYAVESTVIAGAYVPERDATPREIDIYGLDRDCADAFNCETQLHVALIPSRPLTDDEVLHIHWRAEARAYYEASGDDPRPPISITSQLFELSE